MLVTVRVCVQCLVCYNMCGMVRCVGYNLACVVWYETCMVIYYAMTYKGTLHIVWCCVHNEVCFVCYERVWRSVVCYGTVDAWYRRFRCAQNVYGMVSVWHGVCVTWHMV